MYMKEERREGREGREGRGEGRGEVTKEGKGDERKERRKKKEEKKLHDIAPRSSCLSPFRSWKHWHSVWSNLNSY